MTGRTPRVLRVALPAAWYELDLDPTTRAVSTAELVRRRIGDGTDPDAVRLRRELTARLRRLGRDAAEAGCGYAALYDQVVAGVPLSASLLTTVLPAPRDLTPAALGALLVASRAAAAAHRGPATLPAVRAMDLPAGPAARLRLAEAVDGTPALEVQYALPAPDGGRIAVLTFATPATAYAEPFEQLFDAVAGTASWVG